MSREPLYKSTITVWSRRHPTHNRDLEDLAKDAVSGSDTYLSGHKVELVENPEDDRDWDGTDFFNIPDTGNEDWDRVFLDEPKKS